MLIYWRLNSTSNWQFVANLISPMNEFLWLLESTNQMKSESAPALDKGILQWVLIGKPFGSVFFMLQNAMLLILES